MTGGTHFGLHDEKMHADLSSVDCKTFWWCVRAVCASRTLIKIISVLIYSILTCVHAAWMHAACCMQTCQNEVTQNCIWLIWPSDPDIFAHFSMFLTCFFLPPLSFCAISDLYFFLLQKYFYHEIGKIKSHFCLKKNLHVVLLKFQVMETQKWCTFYFAKEEV